MSTETKLDVRNVPCVVRDLQGEVVGYVEAPETGALRVKLDDPLWAWIADAINRDVQRGKHLMGPDRTLKIITGATQPELDAIVHTIRVLSERKLHVTPEPPTARTA